ncbi:HAMP domain-containing histidine kinase [Kitasatospora sp. NBC_01287]|uniref:sensor histidine kinase n=1 Tax=Kitasatospora sp. NBC_01287 TaxID=2903573 RepID=UPI00225156D8|nr:HAMP domain-containing sensor histidine kinase [Kitasatospora sp. NBC_01287]MCX4751673.1 HAMP domain-containing histidine kinase [Kitasatospora sp. NBC_01287]
MLTLLVLTCAGVGLTTTGMLRHFLTVRLDQQLSDTGARFAASLERRDAGGAHGTDGQSGATGDSGDTRAQTPGTFGARLKGGVVTDAGLVDGDATDAAVEAGDLPPDAKDLVRLTTRDRQALAALPVGGPPADVNLSSLHRYRLHAVTGQDGDVLVTGLPLRPVEETVHRLATVELLVFGVALVLAGVGGALWIRWSLRPLGRVVATAEAVSTLPLSNGAVALTARAPDDDPRTEVGLVGSALNRMLGHLEDALAQRQAVEERLRAFTADAGHELRTPLANVRGHTELALRHPDPLPSAVRHSLTRIDAESQRMGRLVEDLLLLARLDSGRPPTFAEVDLTRITLDCATDARAAGPEHRWRLALPEQPVLVHGDADRLRQVVGNLLTNARTHTPRGTEVTLRLTTSHEGAPPGRPVRLTVTDTGPGIGLQPPERAFERFVRGDEARSRSSGTTGLGLAIAHTVVEAHGGTLTVASRPGHTAFTVLLPPGEEPPSARGR